MPEIIIEQNKNISNYINVIQLPYSATLNNHIINMVSDIITIESNKNISIIYRKLTSNRDRSTGSRFLSENKWNNEYVDYKRVSHSIQTIRKNVDENNMGFLIVDDSLSKKDNSTKKIEGLDYNHSHSDCKTMWSHCIVSSHYMIADYSLTLKFKLYLRKQFYGSKAKRHF